MRAVFGVLMLLVVVAIVGVLAKKQLSSVPAPASASGAATSATGAPVLQGTPQQQVQQYKNAVQGAMEQPRPLQDDQQK